MDGPTIMSQYITIEHCHILHNGLRGLRIGGDTTGRGMIVRHNLIRGNEQIGTQFVNLRDSVVTDNFIGAQTGPGSTVGLSGANFIDSLVARNVVAGNTNNYSFSPGSPVRGGIVTKSSGFLETTGVEAHPWANFGW
jgi:hypothetical protein